MLRRYLLSFCLVLLFALGQHGAAVHEISHLADLAPTSQQQDKAPHSPVCDKCDFTLYPCAVNGRDHFASSVYLARAPPRLA